MAEHELIDIVNEKYPYLKVEGTIDKSIAHKNGIWHRSVHVWIINDNNEILMQKRCSDKKFFPNLWDVSFAGHIGAGETSLLSAIREGYEELGIFIDLQNLKYLFTNKEKLAYNKIQSNEIVDVYILKQNLNINDLKHQKEEVETAKWISFQEFFKMITENISSFIPHIEEFNLLKELLTDKTKLNSLTSYNSYENTFIPSQSLINDINKEFPEKDYPEINKLLNSGLIENLTNKLKNILTKEFLSTFSEKEVNNKLEILKKLDKEIKKYKKDEIEK